MPFIPPVHPSTSSPVAASSDVATRHAQHVAALESQLDEVDAKTAPLKAQIAELQAQITKAEGPDTPMMRQELQALRMVRYRGANRP